MRRNLALFAAALAVPACLGLSALTATSAEASVMVSAPSCDSGASHIDCDATASSVPATVTWTVNGSSYSGPNYTYFACTPGMVYTVSYGWVSDGVTYTSYNAGARCSSGPWP
jgi:hypothetical protein